MTRYYRPTTTADALSALAAEGDGARALVGGTDLLVGLRHHTIEPALIVEL
jgi:CO/xanthine dehydrogenase FAD-binding subunit